MHHTLGGRPHACSEVSAGGKGGSEGRVVVKVFYALSVPFPTFQCVQYFEICGLPV